MQYIPQSRTESVSTNREDVAYLVLDDRSLKLGESSKTKKGMTNGELSGKGKEKDQTGVGGGGPEAQTPKDEVTTVKDDDDDIKIIDTPSTKTNETAPTPTEPEIATRPGKRKRERERQQYQTLAVRPAGAVVPMLHNLLNPFVMGVTKSARQVSALTLE